MDVQPPHRAPYQCLFRRPLEHALERDPAEYCEGEVVANRHRQHQPLGLAVLGYERDPHPQADRVRGLADAPGLAIDPRLSAGELARAEERHEKVALALADQPADADDLTATERERDTPQAFAVEEGREKLVATMTGTLMALFGREGIAH